MRRFAPLSLLCLLALSGAAMAGEPAAPAADGEDAAAKLVPAAAH